MPLQEGPGSPPSALPLGSSKVPPRPDSHQVQSLSVNAKDANVLKALIALWLVFAYALGFICREVIPSLVGGVQMLVPESLY